jgi:hypothetical protein
MYRQFTNPLALTVLVLFAVTTPAMAGDAGTPGPRDSDMRIEVQGRYSGPSVEFDISFGRSSRSGDSVNVPDAGTPSGGGGGSFKGDAGPSTKTKLN